MSSRDKGFSLIELLIVVAIVAIITAIATPGLLRARMTSNESSAIASMKVTTTAQAAYAASCGLGAYASNYVILATPPTPGSPGFISEDLGGMAPQKTGYAFTLGPGLGSGAGPNDCNGSATTSSYYATAVPLDVNTTGTRAFATSAGGTIWQMNGAVPPPQPFGPPAVPIQ